MCVAWKVIILPGHLTAKICSFVSIENFFVEKFSTIYDFSVNWLSIN